jgi:isopentenyl phosphate kinase
VNTPEQWGGFVEVWQEADELDRMVVDALLAAGAPAVSFPPSAAILAQDGQVLRWDTAPLERALEAGLAPVIYGDVIFDTQRGGTILSTEELFIHLAPILRPRRLLLAGSEPGVWAGYPQKTHIIPSITPASLDSILAELHGSAAADVTGGMESKVRSMVSLVQRLPGLDVAIFSGMEAGAIGAALERKFRGDGSRGTVIVSSEA